MTEVNEISITKISLTIPFSSGKIAALAHEVLSVDKEIKGSKISRNITTEGTNLVINFYGTELKMLRVGVKAILKNVLLIVKTIDQFS